MSRVGVSAASQYDALYNHENNSQNGYLSGIFAYSLPAADNQNAALVSISSDNRSEATETDHLDLKPWDKSLRDQLVELISTGEFDTALTLLSNRLQSASTYEQSAGVMRALDRALDSLSNNGLENTSQAHEFLNIFNHALLNDGLLPEPETPGDFSTIFIPAQSVLDAIENNGEDLPTPGELAEIMSAQGHQRAQKDQEIQFTNHLTPTPNPPSPF